MSKSNSTGLQPSGTTGAEPTTNRTAIVTDDLELADWPVFRAVAECSEDTIRRLQSTEGDR